MFKLLFESYISRDKIVQQEKKCWRLAYTLDAILKPLIQNNAPPIVHCGASYRELSMPL